MYSKPLASRADGVNQSPAKARRSSANALNFASFMPPSAPSAASFSVQAPGSEAGKAGTPLEQAASQSNLGLNQMRAMAALTAMNAQTEQAAVGIGQEKSPGMALNPRDVFRLLNRSKPDPESAEIALRVKANRKSKSAKSAKTSEDGDAVRLTPKESTELSQKVDATASEAPVGALAAKFESGADGIAAVGYDRHGGTSYGKYQIASRVGTMRGFISFLKTEAPDIAARLEKAGPANTGSKRGKMPDAWRKIAEEQPERFEKLQDKFIRASHFEPAMRALEEKTGIAFNQMPTALHEVVFSTAVQHGPNGATRIVSRSLGQVGENRFDPDKNDPAALAKAQENLIRRIYDNRSGQFRSSTENVQTAVKGRLRQEMSMAISMLRNGDARA